MSDEVERGRKFADPPHPLAMVLQLLGPLVTVVTLLFTVRYASRQFDNAQKALQLSEQTMKVGQRAYLTVQKGFHRLVSANKDFPVLLISVSFETHNLGNTPASQTKVILRFKLPEGWRLADNNYNFGSYTADPNRSLIVIDSIGDIAPKSFTKTQIGHSIGLTPTAKKTLDARRLKYEDGLDVPALFSMDGTAEYVDVFGEHHSQAWTWEFREQRQLEDYKEKELIQRGR